MTTNSNASKFWFAVGSSKTSAPENNIRAQVLLDSYYVVIGFEVNNPKAFINDTHDLAKDYGHAFFYLVKNKSIESFFSFGPAGMGKVGWFNRGRTMTSKKDGQQNARPATSDYGITEIVKAFKIAVTRKHALALVQEVSKMKIEIQEGKVKYSALMNDTCAETAKEVLDEAGVETPSGSGWIKHSGKMNVPIAYAVNPYMWHKNLKSNYVESIFKIDVEGEWIPAIGEDDPIFATPSFARADPIFGVGL